MSKPKNSPEPFENSREILGALNTTETGKINLSISEIIEIYNHVPRVLARKAIKVSPTNDRYLNKSHQQILLTEERNSNYWLITTEDDISYLLPKNNLIINTFNLDTVKSLFNCEGSEQLENREFTLTEPAKISRIPNRKEWQLEAKGTLNFDPDFPELKWRSQLERANHKCEQLQSQLIKKEKERQQLTSQVAQFASEQLQEIHSHLVTHNELKKHLQQAAKEHQHLQEKLSFIERKFQGEGSNIQSQLKNLEKQLRETLERVSMLEQFEGEHQQSNLKIQESIEEQKKLKSLLKQLALRHQNNSQSFTRIEAELHQIKTDKSQLESKLSGLENHFQQQLQSQISESNIQLQQQLTSFKTDSEQQLQSQLSQIKSNTDEQIHLLQTKLEEIEHSHQEIKAFLDHIARVNSTASNTASPSTDNRLTTQDTNNYSTPRLVQILVQVYNREPSSLLKTATEVVETQKSVSDRSLGLSKTVTLENKNRGAYAVLTKTKGNIHYLVPNKSLRITDSNYQTVQGLFECRGYKKGYSDNFQLIKPATVYPLSGNQWQLQERGILEF